MKDDFLKPFHPLRLPEPSNSSISTQATTCGTKLFLVWGVCVGWKGGWESVPKDRFGDGLFSFCVCFLGGSCIVFVVFLLCFFWWFHLFHFELWWFTGDLSYLVRGLGGRFNRSLIAFPI